MKYDTIGIGYDTTRRAGPRIAGRLLALLEPVAGGLYLDIACGTGNFRPRSTTPGFASCWLSLGSCPPTR
jgi:hypothetical protein